MSVTASNVTDSSEKLSFLVLDANAFIRGHGLDLFNKAERLVTTQEVLNEVRDAKAQELLSRLPFTLEVLSPTAEACKEVAAFATKTGDFRQLSKTDLRLIALTYSLYVQVHGEPPKRRKTLADLSKAQTHSQTQKKSVNTASVTVSESSTVSHTDTNIASQTTITTDVITTVIATEDSESESDAHSESESESDNEDNNEPVNENIDENNNDSNEKEKADDEVDAVAESLADISIFPSLSASTTANSITAAAEEEKKEKKPFSWADVAKRPQTVSHNSSAPAARASKLPVRESVIAAHVPEKKETAEEHAQKKIDEAEAAKNKKAHRARTAENTHTQSVQKENESRAMALEDDQTGWINIENLHAVNTFDVFAKDSKKGEDKQKAKREKKEKKSVEQAKKVRVACFTTDFSMQNVLLQLGLKVLASDGMFVRSARQWVLRCVGCHTVHTRDLNRLFCSQCGLSQLSRIAASVDARTGTLRLHLKANYRIDTRGTKFSLPAPGKQNRFDGELLLREDQLLTGIWRQKTVKYNKNVQSAFGESVTEEVGLQLNKLERDVVVGWGSGNPNARRGRERRGKKHTKH